MREQFFVYIISNERNTVLYTGITNDIYRRTVEHKMKWGSRFTRKFNCTKLVYVEMYMNPDQAIAREKQIKAYRREKKDALINSVNKEHKDLFELENLVIVGIPPINGDIDCSG